jgi:aspartyl-tRNA(Asn)/glutamyl-tRNA(Gln) amidotransferase subunit C
MINIKHIAKLAGLKIKNDEEIIYQKQLEEVLNYISALNIIDTEKVIIDQFQNKINNRWSEDIISESLNVEDVLFNTNSKYNNLFKVKAILNK